MKIITPCLVLREFEQEDISDIIRNINDLKVSRYLAIVPYPYNKKDANWWVKHCVEEIKKRPRENYEFGIELKSESKIVGSVGLMKVDRFENNATLGYWLGMDYWRQGIMYEAASALIDFAFDKLKLLRINVEASTKNIPSNGLIKKLGFKYEGTKRKSLRSKSTGVWHNSNFYGLLRNEYIRR